MLQLHYRPYYRESALYVPDSVIYHDVTYNAPHIIDEEFTCALRLAFRKPAGTLPGKTLDLQKDTALIRSGYERSSVWNWGSGGSITGRVTVLKCSPSSVKLRMRLLVYDSVAQQTLHYRGTRTFTQRSDAQ